MKSATRCIRKVSIQCKWNKMKSIQKLVALLLFFSWNKYKNSDFPVTTSVTIQMYVSDDRLFWCFTSMHCFLTSLLGWWCRVLFQSSEAEGPCLKSRCHQSYPKVISFVRRRVRFDLVKATLIALRGFRGEVLQVPEKISNLAIHLEQKAF